MEVNQMTMSEIETRAAELKKAVEEGGDLAQIEAEVTALETRKAEILAEAEKREAEIAEVIETATPIDEKVEERKVMNLKELRASDEYARAYAKYLFEGDDKEARALLTENATPAEGSSLLPVPEYVDEVINRAWKENRIFAGFKKTYFKGVLKVSYEASAPAAQVHIEGTEAIAEENLVLGTVDLIPANVKKWIRISNELYDLRGEALMRYLYDEFAQKIIEGCEELALEKISDAIGGTPAVGALPISAFAADTIIKAEALLSSEAKNLCVITNRSNWAALKAIQVTSGSNVGDVFDGMPVYFSDFFAALTDAQQGNLLAVVGDLSGIQVNMPNGEEIKYVFDDKSLAEADMVKVVGRLYAGIGVIAPNMFAAITKA